jgi:hypothetical protein
MFCCAAGRVPKPATVREIAQIGAAIGREFSYPLLRAVAGRDEPGRRRLGTVLRLLRFFVGHLTRCEPTPLREMAELFLREASAQPNCPEALIAYRNFGTTCLYFGDFAGAHDHYKKSIELYDRARHADFANQFAQDPLAEAQTLLAALSR